MILNRHLGTALRIALGWVIACLGIRLVGDIILKLTTGGTSDLSPLATLTMPLAWLTHPTQPGAMFGPYADQLNTWITLALLGGAALFTWITLMRHGYANPLYVGRAQDELPLAIQLKPRLHKLGIWTAHDPARGDPKASRWHKLQLSLAKALRPGRDAAQLLTHRANGMLVPHDGPQPAARILLGHHRHLHLLRKKKYNVYARPEQHVVIFGPSGAGKGATQMNPSLLFWNGDETASPDGWGAGWPGAIITSTVKADHVDAALEWRMSISDQCYVYDPLQSYPEYRDFWVGWDPLCTIENFSDANAVAAALMESESQQGGASSGNEDYFKAQALMVLSPMLLSAALKKHPFRTVYEWSLKLEAEATNPAVVSDDGNVATDSMLYAVMDPLYDYAETHGDDTPLNQMQQVFTKDPREASGVWGSVRKILQPYNDEKSVMSTDARSMPRMLNPRDFYSTPHATLFIIAPEVANESKRMRPVFAAFITWLIEEAQKLSRERNGKLPYPVLANLDEVKNVGAIPGLAHTLSLTRSIGFFVKHAWQDEAQIASAYGKDDAKTITSNSRTWVVLPGISDPDHLEALARLIGERAVKKRTRKRKDAPERDEVTKERATAAMIKEVKDDELLIITDNLPPFVIKATRYFQDPVMLARYQLGDNRRSGGAIPARTGSQQQPSQPGRTEAPARHLSGPSRDTAPEHQQPHGGGRTLPPLQDLHSGTAPSPATPWPHPDTTRLSPNPPQHTPSAGIEPSRTQAPRHDTSPGTDPYRTPGAPGAPFTSPGTDGESSKTWSAAPEQGTPDAAERLRALIEERRAKSPGSPSDPAAPRGGPHAPPETPGMRETPGMPPSAFTPQDIAPENPSPRREPYPVQGEQPTNVASAWLAPLDGTSPEARQPSSWTEPHQGHGNDAAGSQPPEPQRTGQDDSRPPSLSTPPAAAWTREPADGRAQDPAEQRRYTVSGSGQAQQVEQVAADGSGAAPSTAPTTPVHSGPAPLHIPPPPVKDLAKAVCPDCGRPFSTTGMSAQQVQELLRLHQATKHAGNAMDTGR